MATTAPAVCRARQGCSKKPRGVGKAGSFLGPDKGWKTGALGPQCVKIALDQGCRDRAGCLLLRFRQCADFIIEGKASDEGVKLCPSNHCDNHRARTTRTNPKADIASAIIDAVGSRRA